MNEASKPKKEPYNAEAQLGARETELERFQTDGYTVICYKTTGHYSGSTVGCDAWIGWRRLSGESTADGFMAPAPSIPKDIKRKGDVMFVRWVKKLKKEGEDGRSFFRQYEDYVLFPRRLARERKAGGKL